MGERDLTWRLQSVGDVETAQGMAKVTVSLKGMTKATEDAEVAQTSATSSTAALTTGTNSMASAVGASAIKVAGLVDGVSEVVPVFAQAQAGAASFAAAGLGPVGIGIGALVTALPAAIGLFQQIREEATGGTVDFGNMAGSIDDVISRLAELDRVQERNERRAAGRLTRQEARAEAFRATQDLRAASQRFAQAAGEAGITGERGQLSRLEREAQRGEGLGLTPVAEAALGRAAGPLRAAAEALGAAAAAEREASGVFTEAAEREAATAAEEGEKRKQAPARERRGGAPAERRAGGVDLAAIFAEANLELELFEDLELERIRLLQEDAEATLELQAALKQKSDEDQKALSLDETILAQKQLQTEEIERQVALMQEQVAEANEFANQLSFVGTLWSNVIKDVVAGEKSLGDALRDNFIVLMQQLGEQMIGEGFLKLFQGLFELTSPLTAATGALKVGIGAAQIAVGTGLLAGGSAAGAAVSAGGGGAAPVPSAGPGEGAGGGGGVTIIQQINDPVDEARLGRIQAASSLAAKRNFGGRV